MAVLQTAFAIAGGCDAEQLLAAAVPGRGDFRDSQVAAKQLLFDFEAQDDVLVVGRLVGTDALRARRSAIDFAPQHFRRRAGELTRKGSLHLRLQKSPEAQAAADGVLPQPGL